MRRSAKTRARAGDDVDSGGTGSALVSRRFNTPSNARRRKSVLRRVLMCERSTKDKWGERNVCHSIEVQSAAKYEPPTLARPLIVIRRSAKRPANGRERTMRQNSSIATHKLERDQSLCVRLDANKPQKALRGLDKASAEINSGLVLRGIRSAVYKNDEETRRRVEKIAWRRKKRNKRNY